MTDYAQLYSLSITFIINKTNIYNQELKKLKTCIFIYLIK